MIVLKDDKLVHVDSSLDILEHYGVKGMKWGKRLRVAAGQLTRGKLGIKNKDYQLGTEYSRFKKSQKKSYKDAKRKLKDGYDKREYDREKKFEIENYDDIKSARAKRDMFNTRFAGQPDRKTTKSDWYSSKTGYAETRKELANLEDYDRTQAKIQDRKRSYKQSINNFKQKNFK